MSQKVRARQVLSIRGRFLGMFMGMMGVLSLAQAQTTLQTVQERGELLCGVNQGLAGFSKQNNRGEWQGLDVDFCRALAAAVLKDARKVKFIPLSESDRFAALDNKSIDILSRNTTWTFARETASKLVFAGVYYYDGQGFMVLQKEGVSSIKQLKPVSVCVSSNTTTEINLTDYFTQQNMPYTLQKFPSIQLAVSAYKRGQCQALSSDLSALAALRKSMPIPTDHLLLPEIISKEPLSPAIRADDEEWQTIVRWTLFTLINAEEAGLTSKNIASMSKSTQSSVLRILGQEPELFKFFPLDPLWAKRIIAQVGNYGEIFDKNLGVKGLGLNRGLNQQWNQGGILYAPPMM